MTRVGSIIALSVLLFWLNGCSTTITPPYHPTEPTEVYLCDYGVHSSLLLPVTQKMYVEFLYGDWNWAALGHTGPIDGIEALFFSQQATLARRFVIRSPGEKVPRPIDGPITETGVIVQGRSCRKVLAEMLLRWQRHRLTDMTTGEELSYVKDDVHYSWLHDCNAQTADCLRTMGCKVDGMAIWSNFKIAEPVKQ